MIYSCIDSFCGAGGMRLGLESVGYDVPLSFDFDSLCIKPVVDEQTLKLRIESAKRLEELNERFRRKGWIK